MPIRLLALDIDGTLLRCDGTVAPVDRTAIAAALDRGIAVTLATGRLSSSTLPLARELGLQTPLVCADGAVLYSPTHETVLEETALNAPSLAIMLRVLDERSVAPFVFTHEAVCGAPAHFAALPFLGGWTPLQVPCHDLLGGPALAGRATITAIGVGPESVIASAEAALRADSQITDEVTAFPIRGTDHWVVRLTPAGCTKAVGLARLAGQLHIGVDQVAAIGDWHNDISMLSWAGFSFAMGHAPDEVRRVAKHALVATALAGGAVAEAMGALRARPT